ncbi:uncharacterized membrane protein YbhN (UPF0104 family) [Ilumatobacter fluminis]|uniref:Uncharacterized membrane protein YbhN (UPF0104 family) n=1 Tax=Ilumatobacter fluminis TaxID=467091 RepID=A0A4R7HVR1_9ACTN|nr:lysylphosphatidylglycerol synthase transmembrane domain-containing protein [Ilumatobacter fluminis]TDT15097.1 uncharacterized membrane protein YbhN (UPF0104 family) [Ilumatobacter fluminis]
MSGSDDDERVDDVQIPADVEVDARSRWAMVRSVGGRALLMAVGLGIAGALLVWAFDDLDWNEVVDSVRSLDDAEIIALLSGTVIMVWAESLLTASVVEGLPARRGALAWMGPVAVASIVPGPSDMPVRYKMFVSWGYDSNTAGTAVAASGIINIGMKLLFPVVAAIGLAAAEIPLGTIMSILISGLIIVGVFVGLMIFVIVSERRTHWFGRVLDRFWRVTVRLVGRSREGSPIANWLVDQRAQSIELLRGRWGRAIASGVFVSVARVALLVMCLRFMDVPESAISWEAIFAVWAIQRGLTIVPIMPGGAGVTELALTGLLAAIAGNEFINQITAGVLIFRLLTWLLMIPAGGVALGLWRLGLRKSATAAAATGP